MALLPVARGADPVYAFSTLAGTSSRGNADGPGGISRFIEPTGVAIDASGNIYVADSGNHVIRTITPAGIVSTWAGKAGEAGQIDGPGSAARFLYPSHLAVDAAGNVFVSDWGNHAIRRITPNGVVTTWAGQLGTAGTADGTGSSARFNRPRGLALDASGAVYVADTNNQTIRKISPAGEVSTLAGVAGIPGQADGVGASARFFSPYDLAVDRTGTLYVTESGRGTVRRIAPNGAVTTLGGKSLGGWTDIFFQMPTGVAVDAAGTVYLSDVNHTIRRVTIQGVHDTIAGSADNPGAADGTGVAARFRFPDGLTLDAVGNVIVADRGNNTVRRMTPDGKVTTLAGIGLADVTGLRDGRGTTARFRRLSGIARGSNGEFYVADPLNNAIRRISDDGFVTTVPVSLDLPVVTEADNSALFPVTLAADRAGNLYCADSYHATVSKITPDGKVSVLYRGVKPECWLEAITVDRTGNVYFAETLSRFESRVRKIAPDGTVSVFARPENYLQPAPASSLGHQLTALTVDADDNVYLAYSHYLARSPFSPNYDPWVAKIVKITAGGTCTLLAGGNTDNSSNGPAASAGFSFVTGLAWDDAGRLFMADDGGGSVRVLGPDGNVSKLGGRAGAYFSVDGVGSVASFSELAGIAIGVDGTLYIPDGNVLRQGRPAGPPVILTQPQNLTVTTGSAVQLSVTASAVPEPTYQWFHNGSPFTGATASTLSFANATTADAGEYTVRVTNDLGSVISAKATLTVTATSTPSNPPTPPPAAAGGGGGGAPSAWFLALLALAASRRLRYFPDKPSAWQRRKD